MASPENFLARSGILSGRKNRVPSLIQAIQMDNVKIKRVSSDSLASTIIQNKKRTGRKPKLVLSQRIPLENKSRELEVELRQSFKKISDDKRFAQRSAESKKALTRQYPENPITHGFRYHSNGDERLPRDYSETFETIRSLSHLPSLHANEKRDLCLERQFLSEYLLRDYCTPKLNRTASGQLSLVLDDLQQRYRDGFRRRSEPILKHPNSISCEKNVNQKSSRHHSLLQLPTNDLYTSDNWIYNSNTEHDFDKTCNSFERSQSNSKSVRAGRGTVLQPAKSTFNMRYGVSSKLLASRKPTLEDCKMHELEEASKLKCEIDEFTNSIHALGISKSKHKSSTQNIITMF